MNETNNLLLPPRLERGATIGLVAPAGPLPDEEKFRAGIQLLSDMGYKVKFSPDVNRQSGYLAGPDATRCDEFCSFWSDPEIQAILAIRGGYGSLRIVSEIDMDLIRRHPKILIGFSDITVLLTAILKKANLVTFHGPVLTTLATGDRQSVQAFFQTITAREPVKIKPPGLEILSSGKATGPMLGGNLTTLTHLIGTPHEISWDGAILFLEDVNEAPYRLDRMLTQLKQAGRLDGLAGLILGNFDACGQVEEIWTRALELTGGSIPVWANFPCGHGAMNHILPLGLEAAMNSDTGTLQYLSACVS